MATKRKIVESESSHAAREARDQREEERAERQRAKGETLGEWWRNTYAKYWFAIIAIAIDVFAGLQIATSVAGELGIVLALVFEAAAISVEIYLYRVLWPKEDEEE